MQSDTESTGGDLHQLFMTIMSGLADGHLTFPSPFDLATSIALANNIDVGRLAVQLAQTTAARDCGYEVNITAVDPTDASLRREIINTSVSSTTLLMALLDGLIDELDNRLADQQPQQL